MWYNPQILTGADLELATTDDLLRAIYQFQVSSTLVAFAIVVLYFVFKTAVWFLPNYWKRTNQ